MSRGGHSAGSSTIVHVVVDASVAVKWFVPEKHSDSIYLALAVALDCKLVTADQKLYYALQTSPFVDDVLWIANAF